MCNAPLFALPVHSADGGERYQIVRGNCHSWTCPDCGEKRARHEYGRIVYGAEELARQGYALNLLTITTKGGGLSVKEAETGYLQWTNRLLTALRKDAKRQGLHWAYVAVTERQKRGHPHSHFITTYQPDDLKSVLTKTWETNNEGVRIYSKKEKLVSDYMWSIIKSSGMGQIYDIQPLRSVEAASRYVAKYLFKSSMQTVFPPGWRRVRYSQSYPTLPPKGDSEAIVLLNYEAWRKLRFADMLYTEEALEEIVKTALPHTPVRTLAVPDNL